MGEVLALVAAVCFGANHFLGGVLSRRASSSGVALAGQVVGTVVAAVVAVVVPASHVGLGALGWGALSGMGRGLTLLRERLSRGQTVGLVAAGVAIALIAIG